MNILITGVNGQVGSSLVSRAKALEHEVIEISRERWNMAKTPEQGEELVLKVRPDLVINAAAYTNVDGAEENEANAFKVNSSAPRALAKGCNQLDIPLLHISTDYVFDGAKSNPYVETDQTNPINAYGRSKLAGEQAIQDEMKKYIILRTSWVFSRDRTNFLNTILRLAIERTELKIINDQIGGPTYAGCIAEVLLQLAIQHEDRWGIYHYSGQPFVSWFEFAKKITDEAFKYGVLTRLPTIEPCASRDLQFKAQRPLNSRLSGAKLNRYLNLSHCYWTDKLRRCL